MHISQHKKVLSVQVIIGKIQINSQISSKNQLVVLLCFGFFWVELLWELGIQILIFDLWHNGFFCLGIEIPPPLTTSNFGSEIFFAKLSYQTFKIS